MHVRTAHILAAAALAGAVSAAAAVQPQDSRVHRVDPGVGDMGGGGVGRVDIRRELRRSNDFGSVYEYRGSERPGSGRNGFYFRIAGGVTAVFPRSSYRMTLNGPVAEIPPGTVFYLGGLPPELLAEEKPVPARSFNYLDLSAAAGQNAGVDQPAAAGGGNGGGGWTMFDEPYRRRRVAALLRHAADLEPERSIR